MMGNKKWKKADLSSMGTTKIDVITQTKTILLFYFLVLSLTISTLEVLQLSNVRITTASVVRSNTISQNENEKSHKW